VFNTDNAVDFVVDIFMHNRCSKGEFFTHKHSIGYIRDVKQKTEANIK
jgi:hypothetical protein